MKQKHLLAALAALCILSLPCRARDIIKQGATYSRDVVITAADGSNVTGLASGAFTVKQSKNNGTQVTVTPTITEKGLGHYNVAYTTGMTDTLGSSSLVITASGAVQADVADQIVGFDPTSDLGAAALASVSTAVGLLPNAAAIVTAFNARTVLTGLSGKQADALSASVTAGSYVADAVNTTAHTQNIRYYLPNVTLSQINAGTATVISTAVIHFGTDNKTILYVERTPGTF